MYVISEDDEQASVIVEKIQSGEGLVMLEDWEMKILVKGERIKYYYDSRVRGS